jgi:hypothetical protein
MKIAITHKKEMIIKKLKIFINKVDIKNNFIFLPSTNLVLTPFKRFIVIIFM